MVNQALRDNIADLYGDDILVFDNPSFDNSIIGISNTDQLIYDFTLMVKEFMEENDVEEYDAVEFIEYNTLRSLPYQGEYKPIILMDDIKFFKY